MACETDFSELKEDISELKVSQARAEEKIEGLNVRFEDFTTKVGTIDVSVKEIRDKVVNSSVDAAWLKRIIGMILTALLGAGGAAGYFQAFGPSQDAPVEHVQPADNDNDQ